MLKNQDAVSEPPISTPPISIAQARVTPAELTQALAAIEARRQAEASRLAETIPIDQAVSDLHLDSTSDEIWAEVQAQRAKATAQEANRQQAKQPHEAPAFQAVLPLAAGQQSHVPQTRRRGWRRFVAPVLVIGVLMGAGVIPHSFTPHGFSPSLLTEKHFPVANPILRPLTQEPDGRKVYADDAALVQISEGKPVSQIFVSENAGDNRWKLIKLQGHIYLEGYIARTDAMHSLQGKAFNVFNDSNSGELEGVSTSNIRLRADKTPLLKSGGDSDYSEVTVPNFQPDPLTTLSDWH